MDRSSRPPPSSATYSAAFLVALLEPFVGRIRRSPWLGPALDGVTIAALGPMAGVTIDLARAALIDVTTVALGAAALAVLLRWRPNAVLLIAAGAAVGIAPVHV